MIVNLPKNKVLIIDAEENFIDDKKAQQRCLEKIKKISESFL